MTRHEPRTQGKAKIDGGVASDEKHDSARKHVSGEAIYIDDMAEPAGTLHACLGLSEVAHGAITGFDLSAVRAAPGVVAVLTANDVPGDNDMSPTGLHDEPILADGRVQFFGQPVFAVIAETREVARRACRLAKIDYAEEPALIDVADAADDAKLVTAPLKLERGDSAAAIAAAPHTIRGQMRVGGQDHFYLEGQIAFALPGEDGDVTVFSSTQHPSEVQHMVAHALGVPSHAVTIEVRRMGGGFGGKETQANLFATIAAIAAKKLNRPVKLRPDRDDDMTATGKRHDFLIDYTVGFDDEGGILGVDFTYAARCGYAADLSGPVTDRALFHCDNTYFYPAARAVSRPLYTNTVSNTAFRGFGGPQGMIGAERIIDEVAFALGRDPLEIRKKNLYGTDDRNVTPYHQTVEDNVAERVIAELEASADYAARRREIAAFNAKSPVIKRGLALTPVKFGISFTATHFNQAGALVHVYTDGSVHLNHGGTEMGQGLHTKVAQIVAEEFQIDIDQVKITATTTGKVPNTSATAASSGTDLNGMAAQDAARQIKNRLIAFAAEAHDVPKDQVVFLPGRVRIGNREIPFAELIGEAYMARIQLSAAGFYKTPKIHWDRDKGQGRPFYYFAYGAACAEVSVDTLTGEYMVERVDILHETGRSLNRAIDIGQIEGGFIQGMGWLTTEELVWDGKGRLRTHAPSTYKIPLASDRPKVFNVALADWAENAEPTVHRSKAVGEPPFMLAMCVLHALSDAVASVAGHTVCPRLDAPATPERVLMAVERMKAEGAR
ncbi:xanthine dehydrogenase molybdopterin binding subunit [Nitratireductor aquimarinus]|uniref:xanthine dehydrogenase molybdopterin binding subunit n=1 Tax=Nitratireductor TaxID=245876 RepID=UPI0019D3B1C1|nr:MULTISPECIES: xanthine dehydrogenase molybdopterin binding subunit [Nitratireductor]MBN7775312.1 xanthine dehydrogenase molybdopterin binding subunit [Nitratireductor pacificus]MBN7781326.1 xanthine dehydrogenase molybdopterin binding subunit [Nitratireductor pacificus]MBN7790132.1 xanthine dehydrogenase molybdopterin binding subunit [Nitratireductor aquimarinus]MBY6097699.1 xanthine dehydrogenase molybdopterin binding subunit [Nitratireductor aquimarinus]MCA1260989.1 xanthine dehydrogenase